MSANLNASESEADGAELICSDGENENATNSKIAYHKVDMGQENNAPTLTRSSTLIQMRNDDNKVKWLEITRWILLLLICLAYLIYEMNNYYDPDYNQTISASANEITEIKTPYIYARINKWHRTNHSDIQVNIQYDTRFYPTNIIYTNDYVYDSTSALNWTILRFPNNPNDFFILPPYNHLIAGDDELEVVFYTTAHVDSLRSLDGYSDQLTGYDTFFIESNAIQFTDVNFGEYFNILEYPVDKSDGEYSCGECFTANKIPITYETFYEINVLQVNYFGKATTKYDLVYGGSIQNKDWAYVYSQSHTTISSLTLAINSLHTETKITVEKRITMFDVLSSTGGIFAFLSGILFTLMTLLLFGINKIRGIAPNAGLKDNEKRKVELYLKEIGLIK